MIRIRELRLPLIESDSSRSPQYPHQVEMADAWDNESTILLTAKTGTGKTRSAMLPVLKRNDWAVAVYPTNELL
jgi:superfamily II DNA or RNA helicase